MTETATYGYIATWAIACGVAAWLFALKPDSFALSHADYWRFLTQPWKVATFVLATAGMILIAPYTGDSTWDYYDALFMSGLTFATAPWAIGAIYGAARGALPLKQAYVAVCLWLFSASWSYDLYLFFRDGQYPITWSANLAASSVLYVSAGLLWSLEWKTGRGVTFSFMEEGWPNPSVDSGFSRIVWYALPFMVLVTLLILSFFSNP